jgi:hypothetical protein
MEQSDTNSDNMEETPVNWPENIKFVRSLVWTLYPNLEAKYLEGTGDTEYVKLGYDKTTHEICLISEFDLPEGDVNCM